LDEIKEFKDLMFNEYADFFKNRQRIKNEITQYTKETNEKVEKFNATVERHSSNLDSINSVLPLLIEWGKLTSSAFCQDVM
jgi:hypothetical protein